MKEMQNPSQPDTLSDLLGGINNAGGQGEDQELAVLCYLNR